MLAWRRIPRRRLERHRLALILALLAPAAVADTQAGPSFDCARVTSNVNKLICATPSLGLLDRKLAADYAATAAQAGIDPKSLRADEDRWLRDVRNRCATAAC